MLVRVLARARWASRRRAVRGAGRGWRRGGRTGRMVCLCREHHYLMLVVVVGWWYGPSLSMWAARASRSMGGPSSLSVGRNCRCLWAWLAPLRSPPSGGQLQVRLTRGRIDRVRTIVEGEQVLSCLLRCTKEQIRLDEVTGV